MPRSGTVALAGLALLAAGYALGVATGGLVRPAFGPGAEPGAPREASPRGAVFALGRLQPAGGLVAVVGPPGDRIEKLRVRAGQGVKAGAPLARLASFADRQEEVVLVEQQIEEARRQLAALARARVARLAEIDEKLRGGEATRGAEVEAQKLKIRFLRKQAQAARNRQERLAGLDPGVVSVSAQEKEQADLAFSQAQTELDAAVAARAASEARFEVERKAGRAQRRSAEAEADLARDRISVRSLEQNLLLARLRRDRAVLTAPVGGTVVQVLANDGDATGAGPVLQIAAGAGMAAVAEVYATDVEVLRGWLRDGRKIDVAVTSPALGPDARLGGEVAGADAIASVVARNSVAGLSPRADTDRRVVEVRVTLTPEASRQAARFVGLEVNVEFTLPQARADAAP